VPVSFDLYVWGSPHPVTAEQAERICYELAAGNSSSVGADGRVQGFAQELLGRFPALESLAGVELEASPWSMTPEISASHVIMTISWSRAREVAEFVLALAAGRGLVCFDPQASIVHDPPGQALGGGLRLEFCDGGVVDRPDPAALGTLLQALSLSGIGMPAWSRGQARSCRWHRPERGQRAGREVRAGAPGGSS
jgi:hypothetical protein